MSLDLNTFTSFSSFLHIMWSFAIFTAMSLPMEQFSLFYHRAVDSLGIVVTQLYLGIFSFMRWVFWEKILFVARVAATCLKGPWGHKIWFYVLICSCLDVQGLLKPVWEKRIIMWFCLVNGAKCIWEVMKSKGDQSQWPLTSITAHMYVSKSLSYSRAIQTCLKWSNMVLDFAFGLYNWFERLSKEFQMPSPWEHYRKMPLVTQTSACGGIDSKF